MPLVIVQPTPNTLFSINASPQMPAILCQARITGVQPDPTPKTLFDWSMQITESVQASTCASSRVGNCSLVVDPQSVPGGSWTPVFRAIQGGTGVIAVRAIVQGVSLQASVNVRIRGTNPAALAITGRLGTGTAADRIACHESGRRQFDGTGMPLLGRGGDVGVMQLCNPAANSGQRWSWIANADAGVALLAVKSAAAKTHLNQHQVQGHYPNDQNLDDADVLLRETIQRYNGGAYWTWKAERARWEATPPNGYVASVLACH